MNVIRILSLISFNLLAMQHMAAETADNAKIKQVMIQDLEAVKYNMSIKYAPKEWKEERFGWTLENAMEDARNAVENLDSTTSKDYQKIFKNFLKSTRDYHVNVSFYSTELAIFPVTVKSCDGHFYIMSKDFETIQLPAVIVDMDEIQNIDELERFWETAEAGDELLAIDGVPVKEIVEKLIDAELGGDRTPTGYGLAERMLFCRRGMRGETVPQGTFRLTLLPKGESEAQEYDLPWLHWKEWITNKKPRKQAPATGSETLRNLEKSLRRDYTVHNAEELLGKGLTFIKKNSTNWNSDDREMGFLPKLGKVIWETDPDGDLYAYLYKNANGQNIGYIYLPSFNYADEEADCVLNEIIDVLKKFEKESDALVFDITSNPGGNLFFAYGLLSTLTDHPLDLPKEKEILTQEDAYHATQILHTLKNAIDDGAALEGSLDGMTFNEEVAKKIMGYCQSILDTWNAGKTLTDPLHVVGLDQVTPHPDVQYSKPILVLINELDFSCADFFPAILQDNGRAVLFGKKTAGAGGCVRTYPTSSRFGTNFYTLTKSIGYRTDGQPLENLGVSPDVPYELTKKDLRKNYVDYIKAVNQQIEKMVRNK